MFSFLLAKCEKGEGSDAVLEKKKEKGEGEG